ncbi:hypothetical protein Pla22_20030 [Rubripirellula amarantea]|uniref:PEP-CTERM protein-sorting domain-containing protein n=1 Tax=Rubripirellula amarantea TaxID=2527999 RepID=A0A5C5WUN4_9BACT|nr:hypothetical protein [Rubripirellula amarantea]TWT54356.1 hypothetical protein Pla22_20030 [Rubripirellula amarantea]
MLKLCSQLLILGVTFPFMSFSLSAAEIVRFRSDFTSGEGFQAGRLIDNPDWVGSGYLDVDPTGVGRVIHPRRAGLPVDFNGPVYSTTGVLDAFPSSTFGVGDHIILQTQLLFTLDTFNFGQEIARVGFSRTPGGEIEHGFAMAWTESLGQPMEQAGAIRFFPDMNDSGFRDYAFVSDFYNSISVEGRYAGLQDTVGGTDDLTSNPFLVNYEVEYLGEVDFVGDHVWQPQRLEITDQVTNATFFYDFSTQLPQMFEFDGTNAFVGFELASNGRSSNGLTVSSEFLGIQYRGTPVSTAVPEPNALIFLACVLGAFCLRRKGSKIKL